MTYADWIRLASRSFPRRWRNERGQELLETTIDLAPADARRPSVLRDRPPLGASAGRNRRNLQLGLLALAVLVTAPAMSGVLPSMATAAVGAGCLIVGGSVLVIAALVRHTPLTWDDLIRSRKDPTGCTAGRLENQAAKRWRYCFATSGDSNLRHLLWVDSSNCRTLCGEG
jgi:hypothetical protein